MNCRVEPGNDGKPWRLLQAQRGFSL